MEQYLNPDDQGDLKSMLYSYLKDKAQRRAGVTSKADYEGAEKQFVDQMRLRDMGGLAGGLSEAASMAGTLGGKRAKSDIIPDLNKDLYGSTQGAYENFRTLRDTEERSNMNDLNVARYLTGLEQASDADKLNRRRQDFSEQQYSEQAPNRELQRQMLRQKLQSQRVDPNLQWEDGSPVVMGPDGQHGRLPTGIKYRDKSKEDPYLDLRRQQIEAGIDRTRAQTEALKNKPVTKDIGPAEKSQISALGTKVANQASIVNVLSPANKSFREALARGDKDGAIKIGQGMLKALNSDQGSDAVGIEEAQRIGSLLEFQLFNLTKPGPIFGRDLDAFTSQVDATINKLKSAVQSGQGQLESLSRGGKITFDETPVKTAPRGQGKIHVQNPKTGEQFYIGPSDLPSAEADGFEVVK